MISITSFFKAYAGRFRLNESFDYQLKFRANPFAIVYPLVSPFFFGELPETTLLSKIKTFYISNHVSNAFFFTSCPEVNKFFLCGQITTSYNHKSQ
jgi:hypothetical protein